MLRYSFQKWAKRTPGYVFWRQNTLIDLERSKRNYLMSERSIPVSEIARRMVRVRKRYEETRDHHERNLLRGEYKYFSGKISDTRGARPRDLIAFLKCCGFFGFWDTAQVERVIEEIRLKHDSITSDEFVDLFLCLPSLRKQNSKLYQEVANKLADFVSELTVEECLAVCEACTEDTPASLLHNVLLCVKHNVSSLNASQLVNVIDTIAAAPHPIRQHFRQLLERLQERAMDVCHEFDCVDIAVLYTALKFHDNCTKEQEKKLLQCYIARAPSSCARSLAMMFSAASNSLEVSLWTAQAMAERTLFLATDFTPAEMLCAFKIYMRCLSAVSMVAGTDQAQTTTRAAIKPLNHPNVNSDAISKAQAVEVGVATEQQARLRHVLVGLCEQLVLVLEAAASYVTPADQIALLEVYESTLDDLSLVASNPVSLLLEHLPRTPIVMHVLANKIIAQIKQNFLLEELLCLLKLANALGSRILPDAVVSAVIRELLVRQWKLSSDEALSLANFLSSMQNLRNEHQERIRASLIPKLRTFV